MTTADLNQLTISGCVRSEPELRQAPGDLSSCSFVLTHTVDHQESGHWELQFYNVNIYGPLAESFAETFKAGQEIIITGRLDCEHHETLIGYQPVVSIIADSIITLRNLSLHEAPHPASSTTEQLPA